MPYQLTAIVAVLFVICSADALHAQTYGQWPRSCSLGLGPRFSAPYGHGVYFQGQEFLTDWKSDDQSPPLESTELYHASPDPHPFSVDRKYRWNNSGVEVYCYIVRTPYYVSHAATLTGNYRGTLQRVELACGEGGGGGGGYGEWGTGTEIAPVTDAEYNPYDPGLSSGEPMLSLTNGEAEDCNESGSGSTNTGTQYEPGDYTGGETVDWGTGEGNGGTSVCGSKALVEYVCIDTYNPETGFWEEWGCGYVTTC